MPVNDTDLLLVQRGSTPKKAQASVLADYIKDKVDASDIQIASASQLGVVRIGKNLTINPTTGVLDADASSSGGGGGIQYQGTWSDAINAPTVVQNGYFWIWDGGNTITLNGPSWGTINGSTISNGDRIFYDGTDFDIVPSVDAGLLGVSGTAPIQVDSVTDPTRPDISILSASSTNAGSMSASDKAKLDGIEAGAQINVAQNLSYSSNSANGEVAISGGGSNATITAASSTKAGLMTASDYNKLAGIQDGAEPNADQNLSYLASATNGRVLIDGSGTDAIIPAASTTIAGLMTAADKVSLNNLLSATGGVDSVVAGNGINVDDSDPAAPVVSVEFGSVVGNPTTVMPYDTSLLAVLP